MANAVVLYRIDPEVLDRRIQASRRAAYEIRAAIIKREQEESQKKPRKPTKSREILEKN